jgi:hypothetical protein
MKTINLNDNNLYEQAYTNELEINVSRLEEENEMLRKRKVGFYFEIISLIALSMFF